MHEMDVESDVKLIGVLVSEPELDKTETGQYLCRIVLPKRCAGGGELNKKPYWLQICAFGALAEQAAKIPLGSKIVVCARINANRWEARDGSVKTSQNYIAYKVGIIHDLTAGPEWLPGASAKERTKKAKKEEVPIGPSLDEKSEPETVITEIDKYLGQPATTVPGSDVPF